MSKEWQNDIDTALVDFLLIPIFFLLALFIVASLVEIGLNLNIESFKLLFIALIGTPLFIYYFKEKLTE